MDLTASLYHEDWDVNCSKHGRRNTAEKLTLEIRPAVRTNYHEIDLVVTGTHGRCGIERYFLGSVTEKTVRTSPVPVMTVRQTE